MTTREEWAKAFDKQSIALREARQELSAAQRELEKSITVNAELWAKWDQKRLEVEACKRQMEEDKTRTQLLKDEATQWYSELMQARRDLVHWEQKFKNAEQHWEQKAKTAGQQKPEFYSITPRMDGFDVRWKP